MMEFFCIHKPMQVKAAQTLYKDTGIEIIPPLYICGRCNESWTGYDEPKVVLLRLLETLSDDKPS